MKTCLDHWQMMRDAIDERGMTGLIAKSGEAAMDDQMRAYCVEQKLIAGTQ